MKFSTCLKQSAKTIILLINCVYGRLSACMNDKKFDTSISTKRNEHGFASNWQFFTKIDLPVLKILLEKWKINFTAFYQLTSNGNGNSSQNIIVQILLVHF